MKKQRKPSKSLMEKETILRFSEDRDEAMTIYTHRRGLAARMQRLGAELVSASKVDGKVVAWTFHCPSKWFRAPRKPMLRGPRNPQPTLEASATS